MTEPVGGGGSGSFEWLGREGRVGENFTIDLGQASTISEIDLYNTHNGQFNDRSTGDFHVVAGNAIDGSGALVGGTTILSGTLSNVDNQPVITPDVFNASNGLTSGTTAYRYIQFFADTPLPGKGSTGLNEIDVLGSPAAAVPEPATLALMSIGGAALGGRYLRRRRA